MITNQIKAFKSNTYISFVGVLEHISGDKKYPAFKIRSLLDCSSAQIMDMTLLLRERMAVRVWARTVLLNESLNPIYVISEQAAIKEIFGRVTFGDFDSVREMKIDRTIKYSRQMLANLVDDKPAKIDRRICFFSRMYFEHLKSFDRDKEEAVFQCSEGTGLATCFFTAKMFYQLLEAGLVEDPNDFEPFMLTLWAIPFSQVKNRDEVKPLKFTNGSIEFFKGNHIPMVMLTAVDFKLN